MSGQINTHLQSNKSFYKFPYFEVPLQERQLHNHSIFILYAAGHGGQAAVSFTGRKQNCMFFLSFICPMYGKKLETNNSTYNRIICFNYFSVCFSFSQNSYGGVQGLVFFTHNIISFFLQKTLYNTFTLFQILTKYILKSSHANLESQIQLPIQNKGVMNNATYLLTITKKSSI